MVSWGGGWEKFQKRSLITPPHTSPPLVQTRRNKRAALKLMRKLLKKYGFVPDKLVTDELRSYAAESQNATSVADGATIERRIRISQPDEGRGRCKGSRAWDPRKDFSQPTQPPITPSTSNAI